MARPASEMEDAGRRALTLLHSYMKPGLTLLHLHCYMKPGQALQFTLLQGAKPLHRHHTIYLLPGLGLRHGPEQVGKAKYVARH